MLEAASFLYALIELLEENGIITIEELDERRAKAAKRMERRFLDKHIGVNLQQLELNEYAF